jgi:hypothetical protein
LGALWTLFKEEGEKEGTIQRKKVPKTKLGMVEMESHRQRWFFFLPSLLRALI